MKAESQQVVSMRIADYLKAEGGKATKSMVDRKRDILLV